MTQRTWPWPTYCQRFITILFGSNIGVSSALLSGLAAAYFVYPPQFSMAIDNPENLIELGFLLVLSVTASKSVAVLTDEKPLYRRPARKLDRTAFVTDRRWRRVAPHL